MAAAGLRAMVGVKRVIDYAVKVRCLSLSNSWVPLLSAPLLASLLNSTRPLSPFYFFYARGDGEAACDVTRPRPLRRVNVTEGTWSPEPPCSGTVYLEIPNLGVLLRFFAALLCGLLAGICWATEGDKNTTAFY